METNKAFYLATSLVLTALVVWFTNNLLESSPAQEISRQSVARNSIKRIACVRDGEEIRRVLDDNYADQQLNCER